MEHPAEAADGGAEGDADGDEGGGCLRWHIGPRRRSRRALGGKVEGEGAAVDEEDGCGGDDAEEGPGEGLGEHVGWAGDVEGGEDYLFGDDGGDE